MILTFNEKRSIAKMVIESNDVLITEARYDWDLRDEIVTNLKFYNAIKESFFANYKTANIITEDILSALGGFKDLLTGIDIVKQFNEWLTKKLLPKLLNTVEKFIPGANEMGTRFVENVGKFIEWLKKTLSYDGISKLFAMMKYRTLKPTDEQKKCMLLAAKSAYRYILIALVTAFLIKISGYGVEAVDSMITQASVFKGFDNLLASAGVGKFIATLFGAYGSYTKADKARKLKSDIEKKRSELETQSLGSFSKDWGYCDNKNIE